MFFCCLHYLLAYVFFFSLAATAPYRYILLLSLASPEILPATCAAEQSAEWPLSPGFLRLCVSLLLIMFVCSHPPHQKKGQLSRRGKESYKNRKEKIAKSRQKKKRINPGQSAGLSPGASSLPARAWKVECSSYRGAQVRVEGSHQPSPGQSANTCAPCLLLTDRVAPARHGMFRRYGMDRQGTISAAPRRMEMVWCVSQWSIFAARSIQFTLHEIFFFQHTEPRRNDGTRVWDFSLMSLRPRRKNLSRSWIGEKVFSAQASTSGKGYVLSQQLSAELFHPIPPFFAFAPCGKMGILWVVYTPFCTPSRPRCNKVALIEGFLLEDLRKNNKLN